jgi:hypothetical protein
MNTTVITVEEADFGVGLSDRVMFVDSKYTVDEQGFLHVFSEGGVGNVASFPSGSWRAVVRGNPQPSSGVTEVTR